MASGPITTSAARANVAHTDHCVTTVATGMSPRVMPRTASGTSDHHHMVPTAVSATPTIAQTPLVRTSHVRCCASPSDFDRDAVHSANRPAMAMA